MRWQRFVVIGDSTTEGVGDPAADGRLRGWADRLAEQLAATSPGLTYANLAVRGRVTREVYDEQLGPALALRPDLTAVFCGMNDLLRPRFDTDVVVGTIERMLRALGDAGATTFTFTLPDPVRVMPVARPLRARFAAYSRAVRDAAGRTGARVVDLAAHPVAGDPRLWTDDRLHANPDGHARIAAAAADVLGLQGDSGSWTEPLPPEPVRPLLARALVEVDWARRYFLPWIGRRLRGASSGDGFGPKRPTLLPVDPAVTS